MTTLSCGFVLLPFYSVSFCVTERRDGVDYTIAFAGSTSKGETWLSTGVHKNEWDGPVVLRGT